MSLNIVPVHLIVNVDVYLYHFLIVLVFVVHLLRVAHNLLRVNQEVLLVNPNIYVFAILDVIHVLFVIQC
jgi:hypothetical protein